MTPFIGIVMIFAENQLKGHVAQGFIDKALACFYLQASVTLKPTLHT